MKDILRQEKDVSWLPIPNAVEWALVEELPPAHLVTGVFVFAFDGEDLSMMEHVRRGADLPGGHVEAGESCEDAALREYAEETGGKVTGLHPLAVKRITLLGAVPEAWRYPTPVSYLAFFTATVVPRALEGALAPDSVGKLRLTPEEVRGLPWYAEHGPIYEAALGAARANI